jgi:hypothetical protein
MGWKKGQTGNPTGRPVGIPDRRSQLRDLLQPDAPALIEKVVKEAKAGDMQAMRICMERLIPPLRQDSEPVQLDIDIGDTPTDTALNVLQAISAGKLSIADGASLLGAVASAQRIHELESIEQRLQKVEKRCGVLIRRPAMTDEEWEDN